MINRNTKVLVYIYMMIIAFELYKTLELREIAETPLDRVCVCKKSPRRRFMGFVFLGAHFKHLGVP